MAGPQNKFTVPLLGDDGHETLFELHRADPFQWLADFEAMLQATNHLSRKQGELIRRKTEEECEAGVLENRKVIEALGFLETLPKPEPEKWPDFPEPARAILLELDGELLETHPQPGNEDAIAELWAIITNIDSNTELDDEEKGRLKKEIYKERLDFLINWARLEKDEELDNNEKRMIGEEAKRVIKEVDLEENTGIAARIGSIRVLIGNEFLESSDIAATMMAGADATSGEEAEDIGSRDTIAAAEAAPTEDAVAAGETPETSDVVAGWREILEYALAKLSRTDTVWEEDYADDLKGGLAAVRSGLSEHEELQELANQIERQLAVKRLDYLLNRIKTEPARTTSEKADRIREEVGVLEEKFPEEFEIQSRIGDIENGLKIKSRENLLEAHIRFLSGSANPLESGYKDSLLRGLQITETEFEGNKNIVALVEKARVALKDREEAIEAKRVSEHKDWLKEHTDLLLASARPLESGYKEGLLANLDSIEEDFKGNNEIIEAIKEVKAAIEVREEAIELAATLKRVSDPHATWTELAARSTTEIFETAIGEFPDSELIKNLADQINIELHARRLDLIFRGIRNRTSYEPPTIEQKKAEDIETEIAEIEAQFSDADQITSRVSYIRGALERRMEINHQHWKDWLINDRQQAENPSVPFNLDDVSERFSRLKHLKDQCAGLDDLIELVEEVEEAVCFRYLKDRLEWINTQDQSTVEAEEATIQSQLAETRVASRGDTDVENEAHLVELAIERKKETPVQRMQRELIQALTTLETPDQAMAAWEEVARAEAEFAEELKNEIRAAKRRLYKLDLHGLSVLIEDAEEEELIRRKDGIQMLIEQINELFGKDAEMVRRMDEVREAFREKTGMEIPREDIAAREAAENRRVLVDICELLDSGNIGEHAEKFEKLIRLARVNPEDYSSSNAGRFRLIQNLSASFLMDVLNAKSISGDTLAEKHAALLAKSRSEPTILIDIINDLSEKKIGARDFFDLIEAVNELLEQEEERLRVEREAAEREAAEEEEGETEEEEGGEDEGEAEESSSETESLSAAALAFNRSIAYLESVAEGDTTLKATVKNMGRSIPTVLASRNNELIPLAIELRLAVREFAEPLEETETQPGFFQGRLREFLSDNEFSITPINQAARAA